MKSLNDSRGTGNVTFFVVALSFLSILFYTQNIVGAAFGALILAACFKDITTFTIPNWIPVSIFCLFIIAVFFSELHFSEIMAHVITGLVVLLITAALFFSGFFGGGDAKLFAALALWFGWPHILLLTIYTVFLGGFLAVFLLLFRYLARKKLFTVPKSLESLLKDGGPAPYGVAIGGAAILLIPLSIIV